MKKLLMYVVVCGWLFALLDWKVIELTRFYLPELKNWMHSNEHIYALVTRTIEMILCTPAVALKPVFQEVLMAVEAAKEQQDAIIHAPRMNWQGFYQLTDRNYSWTFVPWIAWIVYWIPPSLIWWLVVQKILRRQYDSIVFCKTKLEEWITEGANVGRGIAGRTATETFYREQD